MKRIVIESNMEYRFIWWRQDKLLIGYWHSTSKPGSYNTVISKWDPLRKVFLGAVTGPDLYGYHIMWREGHHIVVKSELTITGNEKVNRDAQTYYDSEEPSGVLPIPPEDSQYQENILQLIYNVDGTYDIDDDDVFKCKDYNSKKKYYHNDNYSTGLLQLFLNTLFSPNEPNSTNNLTFNYVISKTTDISQPAAIIGYFKINEMQIRETNYTYYMFFGKVVYQEDKENYILAITHTRRNGNIYSIGNGTMVIRRNLNGLCEMKHRLKKYWHRDEESGQTIDVDKIDIKVFISDPKHKL